MNRGPGRRPGILLLVVCGILAEAVVARAQEGAGLGAPLTIDVLAPPGSRLADELRRELGASGFAVALVESTGTDWRAEVRRLLGNQARRGVVVRADEQLMTVFTRGSAPDSIAAHLAQPVEPRDRMARRRACLGVVEYLRVLYENEAPGRPAGAESPAQQPRSRPTPAAAPPPGSSPPSGSASAPQGPIPQDATVTPSGSAPALASPPPGVEPATPQLAAEDLPRESDEEGDHETGRVSAGVATPGSGAGEPPAIPLAEPPAPRRVWEIGVGSTLGLEAAPGGPTGHLQLLWYLPLEWRLALCVRALWPVWGGQFRTAGVDAGVDVRVWTFGGAVSLHYVFEANSHRLRPFAGASMGSRVALTEATPVNALQSQETFTPSMNLGVVAGVRYALGPPIHLFLEVDVARGWLIPGVHRASYIEKAANADSLHASFGVLFEI